MSASPPVTSLNWDVVDSAYLHYLSNHPEMHERWLMVQLLATGPSRRALLGALGVEEGSRVLDVGTGFGPTPLELTGIVSIDAIGLDNDPKNLATANELADGLRSAGWFRPRSTVSFMEGDVYDLPVNPDSFDLAAARLLFQHLDDPGRASEELFRVVKPGGGVCVVDADDGLSISYPEPSDAFRRLQRAFGDLQSTKGGDRFVGRKLSTYLEQAGFSIMSVVVLPQAIHGPSSPTDPSRVFAMGRLQGIRDEAVAAGVMTAEEFDSCLELFAHEQVEGQCTIEAHLAVVAKKPV